MVTFNENGDAVAVSYQFVVTNTGNEDLDTLRLIDNKIGDLTDSFLAALDDTVLPVGGSVTFTAIHDVEIDDFTAGSLTNVVGVTGVGVDSGGVVVDSDTETIAFTQVAGVVIVDDSQPVATEARTLPRTGFDTGVLAGLGLLLAALGAGALLLGRRREEGDLS
ncbi:MAG: LPXTG cell wall anchor domain-containing protein [Nitriliruptor sp.]|nr:MAG: LPXTG cell wall anchor domain-containing protein [Nitriliruptor sp.]